MFLKNIVLFSSLKTKYICLKRKFVLSTTKNFQEIESWFDIGLITYASWFNIGLITYASWFSIVYYWNLYQVNGGKICSGSQRFGKIHAFSGESQDLVSRFNLSDVQSLWSTLHLVAAFLSETTVHCFCLASNKSEIMISCYGLVSVSCFNTVWF